MGNGVDEARTAADDALSAAHDRSDEVARVARNADRQAERTRQYLEQMSEVYRLNPKRGPT